MNFSKNDKAFSFHLFLRPFLGLMFLIVIGTLGYMKIEGWNFLDSLLMSVETLATVGYGFVHDLSTNGKIFTIIYILFGVILFLYIAAEFAKYVVMVNFGKILGRKKMQTKIKNLSNHYIICGYGRTGAEIANQLSNNKQEFIVIDKEVNFDETAQDNNFLYINGDATNDDVLEKAGITKAKGLFCSLSDDVDNLYLTLSARNLNNNLNIVSRCVKAINKTKFQKADASNIILPYEISGRRMVASVIKPHVVDFLDVVIHTTGEELELKMEQFYIKNGSELIDKTIISSEMRQKIGIIVIAIKRNKEFITNPSPDTVLREGDYLITLGTSAQLAKFEKIFA